MPPIRLIWSAITCAVATFRRSVPVTRSTIAAKCKSCNTQFTAACYGGYAQRGLARLRRAIEKGLEHAPICVDRRPGTKRPIFISAGWAGAQAPVVAGQRHRLRPQQDPPLPSQTQAEVPPAVER